MIDGIMHCALIKKKIGVTPFLDWYQQKHQNGSFVSRGPLDTCTFLFLLFIYLISLVSLLKFDIIGLDDAIHWLMNMSTYYIISPI